MPANHDRNNDPNITKTMIEIAIKRIGGKHTDKVINLGVI